MQSQPAKQRHLDPHLGEIYRACVNAKTAEALMNDIQIPLKAWLAVDAISLAVVTAPTVLVASHNPVTSAFSERVKAHAARCLEGKSKVVCLPEDIILQQVGTVMEVTPIDDDIKILWTGALESRGRMVAVATFYRQQSTKVSPIELAALRQIRSLVCDALIRIIQKPELEVIRDKTSDRKADIVVLTIQDAPLIGQAFGLERVKALQDEVIDLIGKARANAFLIARLGSDRLIVIEHPGKGATLAVWNQRMSRICSGIKVGGGLELDLLVEIGEVDGVAGQIDNPGTIDGQVVRIPMTGSINALVG
jgi:hypothetical protein